MDGRPVEAGKDPITISFDSRAAAMIRLHAGSVDRSHGSTASWIGLGMARAALAYLFVNAGMTVLSHPEGPAGPAARVTDKLKAVLPALDKVPTTAFVRLNAATHLLAGIGLLVRRATAPAALVLAGSLVPTSVAAFPFWALEEPQRAQARNEFTKNIGLMAGLVAIAATVPPR
jgi:putative oxidoreductase